MCSERRASSAPEHVSHASLAAAASEWDGFLRLETPSAHGALPTSVVAWAVRTRLECHAEAAGGKAASLRLGKAPPSPCPPPGRALGRPLRAAVRGSPGPWK